MLPAIADGIARARTRVKNQSSASPSSRVLFSFPNTHVLVLRGIRLWPLCCILVWTLHTSSLRSAPPPQTKPRLVSSVTHSKAYHLLGLCRYFAPVSYACDPYHSSFPASSRTLLCSLSRIHLGCRRKQLVHMGDYVSSGGQGRRDGRDGKIRSLTNTISLSPCVCCVAFVPVFEECGIVCGLLLCCCCCTVEQKYSLLHYGICT